MFSLQPPRHISTLPRLTELNAIFMAELAKRGYMLVEIPKEPQEPPAGIAPPRGSKGSGGSQH
jgi:hypothetical protein